MRFNCVRIRSFFGTATCSAISISISKLKLNHEGGRHSDGMSPILLDTQIGIVRGCGCVNKEENQPLKLHTLTHSHNCDCFLRYFQHQQQNNPYVFHLNLQPNALKKHKKKIISIWRKQSEDAYLKIMIMTTDICCCSILMK